MRYSLVKTAVLLTPFLPTLIDASPASAPSGNSIIDREPRYPSVQRRSQGTYSSDELEKGVTTVLTKRRTVQVPLEKAVGNYYAVPLEIGTPGQAVKVKLDTAMSDSLVHGIFKNCPEEERANGLCQGEEYRESKSETVKYEGNHIFDVSIHYFDGRTEVHGVHDKVHIGGVDVKDVRWLVALTHGDEEVEKHGMLGVGVSPSGRNSDFLQAMIRQDLIHRAAYSLWLDRDGQTGSILFGGFDKSKYHGELETLPMRRTTHAPAVDMTALSATLSNGSFVDIMTGNSYIAMFSSGDSITYLPEDIVFRVGELLGAEKYENDTSKWVIPCDNDESSKYENATLNFGFGDEGSLVISVPLAELVRGEKGTGGTSERAPKADVCFLGVGVMDDNLRKRTQAQAILGESFLRSAYVLLDLDDCTVGMAPSRHDGGEEDIIVLGDAISGGTRLRMHIAALVVLAWGVFLGVAF